MWQSTGPLTQQTGQTQRASERSRAICRQLRRGFYNRLVASTAMSSIWIGARATTMTLDQLRDFGVRCSCHVRDFNFAGGGYVLMDVPEEDEVWCRETLHTQGCNLGRQGLRRERPSDSGAAARLEVMIFSSSLSFS